MQSEWIYKLYNRFLSFGERDEGSWSKWKVQEEIFNQVFRKMCFQLSEIAAIDEYCLPFTGKSPFIIFNGRKPSGKFFHDHKSLSDSKERFCLKYMLYHKNKTLQAGDPKRGPVDDCVTLMNELSAGTTLATDNLFGHEKTFNRATELGINYVSTIRFNRTICPEELRLCKKKLLPEINGLTHYLDPDHRICLNYRQKTKDNGFIIGTNFVGPSANLKTQYRNSKGRSKTEEIYNTTYFGQDKFDHVVTRHPMHGIKTNKWTIHEFRNGLDMLLINAITICRLGVKDPTYKKDWSDPGELMMAVVSRFKEYYSAFKNFGTAPKFVHF